MVYKTVSDPVHQARDCCRQSARKLYMANGIARLIWSKLQGYSFVSSLKCFYSCSCGAVDEFTVDTARLATVPLKQLSVSKFLTTLVNSGTKLFLLFRRHVGVFVVHYVDGTCETYARRLVFDVKVYCCVHI